MTKVMRNRVLTVVGLSTLWSVLQSAITYPLPLVSVYNELSKSGLAAFHTLYIVLVVVLLIVFVKRQYVFKNLSGHLYFSSIGLLGTVGSVFLLFCSESSLLSMALTGVVLMLMAFFVVTTILGWGEKVAEYDDNTLPMVVISSFGLHLAYTILIIFASIPVFLIWIACPIISGTCLAIMQERVIELKPELQKSQTGYVEGGEGYRQLRAMPWAILLPCCLFVLFGIDLTRLLVGTSMTPSSPNDSRLITMLISAVVIAGLFVVYRLAYKADVRFTAFAYLATVFVAAFLVAIIIVDNDLPYGTRVVISVEHCIEAFVWIVLATAVRERRLSAKVAFSFYTLAIVALPQFVASDLMSVTGIVSYIQEHTAATTLTALSAVIAFVVAISLLMINYSRMVVRANREDERRVEQAFAKASAAAGLSPRESEIMAMLYHNQNPQNIADVLVIGRSTVNSHIKHLYAKLSIHSRLDLMRRIDQYKADF